jgi:hypothetical protein
VAPSKRFKPRYATGIIQRCLDSLQGFKFARIFYIFLAVFVRHALKYQGNESSQKSNRFRDLSEDQKVAVPALNDQTDSHILARILYSGAIIGLGFGTGVLMAVVLACV